MADGTFVRMETEDGVALITLDRPPVNALSGAVMEQLEAAIGRAGVEADIKVVVITGAGRVAFVAGADIGEIARLTSADEAEATCRRGQAVLQKIEDLEKPVLAAINGLCLGGGNELAMACHVRVASDRAKFGQPEVNLGIIPGFAGTQRLPRIVGPAKATELILTGTQITAQEALRIGLVNAVVPDGDLLKHATGLARQIAAKGQVAIRAALRAIRESVRRPLAEGASAEAALFGTLCRTTDMREGLRAFLEKRQPQFQDR